MPSSVSGGPRTLLRLEGLAVLVASAVAYHLVQGSWPLFALLFLAPDLAMVGYLAGPRAGAVAYNTTHTYLGPAALAGAMAAGALPAQWELCQIWSAHAGMDRALGYGLKYATAFGDTHLGPVGRRSSGQGGEASLARAGT